MTDGAHHSPFRLTTRSLQPRLALALGDAEQERRYLPTLHDRGRYAVVVCEHADELLALAHDNRLDMVILSSQLPGLTERHLDDLLRTRAGDRLVFLADEQDQETWSGRGLPLVLPRTAPPAAVVQALEALPETQRSAPRNAAATSQPAGAVAVPSVERDSACRVIAVVSGAGSPGRTTVASNLAAALGRTAPTILLDADLLGPSVAAYLGLDPRRNLFQVAYADPQTPAAWEEELVRQLQPMGSFSPHTQVLCGVATPAMRSGMSARFFTQLLSALEAHACWVVADLGNDLLGRDADSYRALLLAATTVLLVASPEPPGLARLQVTRTTLEQRIGLDPERIALVINRHERHHHGRGEIEWALGRPLTALIPYDHRAAARATAAQQPVILDRRCRPAKELLALAARLQHDALPAATPVASHSSPHQRRLVKTPVLFSWAWSSRSDRLGRTGLLALSEQEVASAD